MRYDVDLNLQTYCLIVLLNYFGLITPWFYAGIFLVTFATLIARAIRE